MDAFSKEQAVAYPHFLQISLITPYSDLPYLLIHVRKKHPLLIPNATPPSNEIEFNSYVSVICLHSIMIPITLKEEFIMLAILNLHEKAYLAKIQGFLSLLTQKMQSKTSTHVSLCRLVGKGYLNVQFGGISHQKGGRRKKSNKRKT